MEFAELTLRHDAYNVRFGRPVSACLQQPVALERLDAAPAVTTAGADDAARTPSDEVIMFDRSDASRRDLGEARCRPEHFVGGRSAFGRGPPTAVALQTRGSMSGR